MVGIYIDPLVVSGEVEQGGPFDSQRRFQNDLFIDNLRLLGGDDYDGDGFQEIYWKTVDGTAYLRSLMHADGNIQYANYQSEQQMIDYLPCKATTRPPGAFGLPEPLSCSTKMILAPRPACLGEGAVLMVTRHTGHV